MINVSFIFGIQQKENVRWQTKAFDISHANFIPSEGISQSSQPSLIKVNRKRFRWCFLLKSRVNDDLGFVVLGCSLVILGINLIDEGLKEKKVLFLYFVRNFR